MIFACYIYNLKKKKGDPSRVCRHKTDSQGAKSNKYRYCTTIYNRYQPRLLKAKEIIQGTFTGFLFHWEDHSQVRFIQPVPALGVANTHLDSPRCPPGLALKP